MRPDAFGDVLEPGEKILVSLGAPRQDPQGNALGWVHLALSESRFLFAEIAHEVEGEGFRVGRREAVELDAVRLERHPRSEHGPARLVIEGMAEILILVDLDRPELFTQLRPFLAVWPGPVGGTGPISLRMEAGSEPRDRVRLTRLPGLLMGLIMGSSLGLFGLWLMD